MASDKWIIPTDWDPENDGSLAVVFCIPNSRQWRGLITAHLNTLTYGRSWNEQTGDLKNNLDVAREIFATMTMCNFEDLMLDVGRIATALESIDDKQPELYTISEILTAITGSGLNFQELEAILNILDLLPGLDIKIDPLKYLLEWIWKGQVLNNMYAQSTAQGAIAAAVATGEVVDTIDTIYDDIIEGGLGTILQALTSAGSFGSFITDVLDLFTTTEPNGEARAIAEVLNQVFVEGDTLNIDNNVSVSVDACCSGGSGDPEQVSGEEGGDPPEGAYPPDENITDRKCKAAHFIIDQISYLIFGLQVNPPPDWYDIGQTEAYLRQLGESSSAGNLLNSLYGSYTDLASAIFGGSPDYEAIYDDIQNHYAEIVCALFGATTATDARTAFLDELTVTGNDLDFVSEFLWNNILNVLFFTVQDSEVHLNNQILTVDCDDCDPCKIAWVKYGTLVNQATGEITVAAQYAAGNQWWWARVYFNAEVGDITAPYCGNEVTITDMTSDVAIYDPANNRPYQGQDSANNFVWVSASPLVSGSESGIRYVTWLNRDSGSNPGPFEGTVKWVV